jgi:hypothetical protein
MNCKIPYFGADDSAFGGRKGEHGEGVLRAGAKHALHLSHHAAAVTFAHFAHGSPWEALQIGTIYAAPAALSRARRYGAPRVIFGLQRDKNSRSA